MTRITRLTEAPLGPDYESVKYRLNNRKRLSDVGANASRTFAIELDNGSVIRVTVAHDQADKFESELSLAIEQNPNSDVGNILYDLTRYFDILDMQWSGRFDDQAPTVEEDDVPPSRDGDSAGEESELSTAPADIDPGSATDAGDESDVGNGNDDGMFDDNQPVDLDSIADDDDAAGDVDELAADPSLKDVLKQMLAQLTSDAAARTAEAEARRSEAEARKAQAIARAMEIKTRRETEIRAMEDWEDEQKAIKAKNKETERLAKFRLAQSQGLVDSIDMSRLKLTQLNEDWGSSDWTSLFRMMKSNMDANPDLTLRQAAESVAEFYHSMMGYDNVHDAVDRILDMWELRAPNRPVRENVATARMAAHVRDMAQVMKQRPLTNPEALDSYEDSILDAVTDIAAQRQQLGKDVQTAALRGDRKEVATARKVASTKLQFFTRLAAMRNQLNKQIQKIEQGS